VWAYAHTTIDFYHVKSYNIHMIKIKFLEGDFMKSKNMEAILIREGKKILIAAGMAGLAQLIKSLADLSTIIEKEAGIFDNSICR
jgi:hypothetical protein